MNGTLLDLSKKVDPAVVDVVAAVSGVAKLLGIPFLIVGAAARDFLLEYACGVRSGRATLDVDFGVRVNSWGEYEKLVKEIEDSEGFVRDKKRRQRFRTPDSRLVDLVPFGPIAGAGQQIIWPPDDERGMSVEGFESAMTAAVEVLLQADPRLVVRTASLPGLALLKILSWDDAYPERRKDGYDFYFIMNSYMETANIDRLSTDAHDLVKDPIPPLQEIGAPLLGQDIASISNSSTAARVAEILYREQAEEGALRLVADMMSAAGASTGADEVLTLLRAVERGFSDIVERT
jgi:predicted nucleotidyltransferase